MSGAPTPRWPDFFIAGAARCGTTFLWSALRAHPELFMPETKEPHFFAADLDTGTLAEGRFRIRERDAYLRLFADAPVNNRVGEGSTSTLLSQAALPAILEVSPDARFIVSLRDPVEAVASRHAQLRGAGFEDLELGEALDAESDRSQGRRRAPRPVFPWSFPYLAAARYGEQLGRLLDHVPRERVLVVLLDDIVADQAAMLARITSFLGVGPLPKDFVAQRNAYRRLRAARLFEFVYSPRTIALARRLVPARGHSVACGVADRLNRSLRPTAARAPVSGQMRARLRDALHDDLARLSELLDLDLVARWWGSGG